MVGTYWVLPGDQELLSGLDIHYLMFKPHDNDYYSYLQMRKWRPKAHGKYGTKAGFEPRPSGSNSSCMLHTNSAVYETGVKRKKREQTEKQATQMVKVLQHWLVEWQVRSTHPGARPCAACLCPQMFLGKYHGVLRQWKDWRSVNPLPNVEVFT